MTFEGDRGTTWSHRLVLEGAVGGSEPVATCTKCLPEKGSFKRSKTLTFRHRKKPDKPKETSKKSKKFWSSFRLKKKLPNFSGKNASKIEGSAEGASEQDACVCTEYRQNSSQSGGDVAADDAAACRSGAVNTNNTAATADRSSGQFITPSWRNPLWLDRILDRVVESPEHLSPPQEVLDELASRNLEVADLGDCIIDIDEFRMFLRQRDIEAGIEVSESQMAYKFRSGSPTHSTQNPDELEDDVDELAVSMETSVWVSPNNNHNDSFDETSNRLLTRPLRVGHVQPVHTQVDYIHCLVPDLKNITNCSFYWAVMDRYEAENLLENKPEGTFLLRDSAQEEFLFSVSFRRYGRSLHARIEQWNHKFTFDSHDPGVYASDTVCGLIEHYKDPSCCMFFEPMLTRPLHRSFPFSLQQLCRSVISGSSTYDMVNYLPLPKTLKQYLKYYHYKQKVRVRKFECAT